MTEGFRLSALPTLSRVAHDRVAHRRDDPDWLASAWTRAQVLLVAPELAVPVRETEDGPRLALQPAAAVPAELPRFFLGEHDGLPYFAVSAAPAAGQDPAPAAGPDPAAARLSWAGLRELGARLGDLDAGLLTTAVALVQWHARHPRCPLCGAATDSVRGGWSRRCPQDDSEHWPRVDPAVIMLVHDGADRCVLGRQPSWPPGRYSILAGFVEPGESAEAAVAREVAEEVGLEVTDIRYAASQPWPFPSSLMLGFVARAADDPLRVDGQELEHAAWFSREQIRSRDGLRGLPPPVSIAHRILVDWLDAG